MTRKRVFWALLITGVIVLSTSVTQAQSSATQESQDAAQAGLPQSLKAPQMAIVGSWLGTSGEGNKLIETYNSDGTFTGSVQTEVSTNPELGVLTPGHGAWKYLGDRQYTATGVGLLYDINTGAYMGYLKSRVMLTINEAGDHMSGTDKVEIYDPDGNLVFAVPPGNTSFTRIKVEPFN
jgi:hypothetical protein